MADDIDVEAMLEEAVDTKMKANGNSSPARSRTSGNSSDTGDSRDSGSENERKKNETSKNDPKRDREDDKKISKDRRERRRSRSGELSRSDRKARDISRSRSRERKSKSKERRSSSKSRNERRRRSRSRDKDRERRRRSRSRSHGRRRRSRSRDRRRRSKSRDRNRRSRSRDHHRRSRSRDRRRYDSPRRDEYISPEERDQRTVFCMQLAARVQARDIEDFFSQVGKVKEVRLIMDHRSRRHKGIAYVEFKSIDSVGKAIALTGTRLMGVPIVVQHSQAEKNRLANTATKQANKVAPAGPMSLYVGSLHFNVNEEMLKGIFEPFGKINSIEISRDSTTFKSNGFGFVQFAEAQDAKKAMEQLNGFDLAGRPMKVNYMTEGSGTGQNHSHSNHITLDSDEVERGGIDLGARGRLELMARLAEGTGIEIPQQVRAALSAKNGTSPAQPISTQCFFLSNMFDPTTETGDEWVNEIKNDVIEECRKHGGVLHVYVDETDKEGHVYVKCASVASAVATINALHGRWFAGRMITASFVPIQHYHNLFPDSATAKVPL